MGKITLLTLLGIVLVILQTSFFSVLFGNEINPNLIFAFCFAFLLLDDLNSALISGIVLGTIFDILTGSTIGLSALLLVLGIYGAYYFERHVLRGKRSYYTSLFISTYLYQLINLSAFYISVPQIFGLLFTVAVGFCFTLLIANYANYKRKTIV